MNLLLDVGTEALSFCFNLITSATVVCKALNSAEASALRIATSSLSMSLIKKGVRQSIALTTKGFLQSLSFPSQLLFEIMGRELYVSGTSASSYFTLFMTCFLIIVHLNWSVLFFAAQL